MQEGKMHYTIKTRGYTEQREVSNVAVTDNQPIKTLGTAMDKILELLEYQPDEIAEILICNDLEKAVYSVRPTGNRSFHVTELF